MNIDNSVLTKVFTSMRFNRKYSPSFIAKRQGLTIGSVRHALSRLVRGGGSRSNDILSRQKTTLIHIKTTNFRALVSFI